MSSKTISILITLVFSFGIYGAGGLVNKEYMLKQVCPQILGIPACYIIMACLIIPLIAHLFKLSNYVYFIGTGIALTIATYGTISQLIGIADCPKTSNGIPMCYISFLIFLTLVVLKWISVKTTDA
ncbi:hypothetical protein [Zobellia barbeyronii]|uniref:Uncharacterized protein n=1 Tax=Zobellia barbeyronii TaxID=2748009 RepID=A0ABS5WF78_9FLAO|nr:hypothetical protein [Zobellia barbeyronii]MBT2160822.1 hypothetical protein [Zobellia barbeyronii]